MSFLGFILLITLCLNDITYSTNSGLSSLKSLEARFYRFSSLSNGLTIVKQSLSLKKVEISLLILFLDSIASENPFEGVRALSRYSFEVI